MDRVCRGGGSAPSATRDTLCTRRGANLGDVKYVFARFSLFAPQSTCVCVFNSKADKLALGRAGSVYLASLVIHFTRLNFKQSREKHVNRVTSSDRIGLCVLPVPNEPTKRSPRLYVFPLFFFGRERMKYSSCANKKNLPSFFVYIIQNTRLTFNY